MELKQLNAKIKSLASRTKNWRNDVQLCLVGCAWQSFEEHNHDPATRLIAVLEGADLTAVIRWIEEHMPARWVKAENKFIGNKSFIGEYDALVLMSEPWWKLAKKAHDVSSTLDCLDQVRLLIARLEREIASGKRPVAHTSVIDDLKALAGHTERAIIK